MIILEKGERADPLCGMDTEIITDEMIEALEQGKRLYLSVNNEYAVVIKRTASEKQTSESRPQIYCKDCRWRNDVGHWLGCSILNSDDDNYCSYAERRTDGVDSVQ